MQKPIYVAIIVVILVAIGFTGLMIFLNYDKKGETNMPFEVSKISIISTANAEDIKDDKNLWNKSVSADNDIYIYVEKNKEYTKKETIEKIVINNFRVSVSPQKGELKIYRPSENEKLFFENKEEYKTNEIIFSGDKTTNMKKLKVSNQGGILQFRVSNEDIGKFVSNDKEIAYKDLLKKINITEEEMKTEISFDISINLNGGKEFKSEVNLNLPVDSVITEGKSSKEITDLGLVFKRVEK